MNVHIESPDFVSASTQKLVEAHNRDCDALASSEAETARLAEQIESGKLDALQFPTAEGAGENIFDLADALKRRRASDARQRIRCLQDAAQLLERIQGERNAAFSAAAAAIETERAKVMAGLRALGFGRYLEAAGHDSIAKAQLQQIADWNDQVQDAISRAKELHGGDVTPDINMIRHEIQRINERFRNEVKTAMKTVVV